LIIAHHVTPFGTARDNVVLYYTKHNELLDSIELSAIEPTANLSTTVYGGNEYIFLPTSQNCLEFYVVMVTQSGKLAI
jgi:hypothetical protein